MIYAFDTYYREDKAKTVCVGFENWEDEIFTMSKTQITNVKSDYVSGQFYKRELPCILNLLNQIKLNDNDIIIVDGFVYLNDDMKLGLGGHLYNAIGATNPIIGVGKSNFATLDKLKRQVLRGKSKKPIYVTAIGFDLEEATNKIQDMYGEFRMPYLLSQLDQMTKNGK